MNEEQPSQVAVDENSSIELPSAASDLKSPVRPSFWQTRYGVLLADGSKSAIARSLSQYGEWMDQELDMIGALIDEGHTAVEYGAEYGAQTLWLSQLVGTSGQVHVIEPRRFEHIALCSTLALNGVRNVYPLHAALGDSREVSVYLPDEGEHFGEASRQIALDSMRVAKLKLIKVNRAGGLLPMLSGAEGTLRSHRPIIYFRLSNTDLATQEITTLKSLGYRCWSHLPYLYNTRNFAGSTTNIFPGWVSQNVIATHKDATEEFAQLHEL